MTSVTSLNWLESLRARAPYLYYLLILGLGALASLAHAPYHYFPLALIAIPGLIYCLTSATSPRSAFAMGFIFGLGYHLGGLSWLWHAFVVSGLPHLAPLGFCGLPIFHGLGVGSITLILYLTSSSAMERTIGFAVLWSLWEWLVGHWVLGGFPWNLIGMIWPLPILQITSFIGIYGLSLLTILGASLLASNHRVAIGLTCFTFAGFWLYGQWRLQHYPTVPLSSINLRVIQPSISQANKWKGEEMYNNLMRHVKLSAVSGEKPLQAVIWPESAVPFFVAQQDLLRSLLQEAVPTNGLLIFGGPRLDPANKNLYPSIFILDDKLKILAHYDKSRLVPFGEYMPLHLPFSKLTEGTRDYTPGNGVKTFALRPLPPFSPLICFEAIFPGKVSDPLQRPTWFLNVTNDAWYGHTSGPYQHLANVRIRAIEEGLPLVRSANNGISAVIDPLGRILYKLNLDEVGYIDFQLPQALPATFYSLHKDRFFAILWVSLFLCWSMMILDLHTYLLHLYKCSGHNKKRVG